MRWDDRRSRPRVERLEARDLPSTISGTVAGALINGPLAGRQTPSYDDRIVGSGLVRPLGHVHVSAITPVTPGEVPRSLTIRTPRAFIRLAISAHGADALESTVPVQVKITACSPGPGARTGARGTGMLEEGYPTPGGTIAFQLTFDVP
jgi:hypothetical protein